MYLQTSDAILSKDGKCPRVYVPENKIISLSVQSSPDQQHQSQTVSSRSHELSKPHYKKIHAVCCEQGVVIPVHATHQVCKWAVRVMIQARLDRVILVKVVVQDVVGQAKADTYEAQ